MIDANGAVSGAQHRRAAAFAAAVAALVWPTAGFSQASGQEVSNSQETKASLAATPAAAPTTSQPDTGQIGEIIVTAQRRSESLQNVPIAVSTASGALLQQRGVSSTQDLAAAVPALTIFDTSGFIQPRIRGIGNNVFGAGYESGVATYIDGVYIASAPAALLTLNNIDRIEVLKGPQGTLFGRNATGGLIQIVTREPSETPGGNIALTYGNYGTLSADAYVTGGLTPGLAVDFGGHVLTQHKGYGVNVVNGEDVYKTDEDISLRASAKLTLGSDTTIRVTGDYEQTKGNAQNTTRVAPGTGYPTPQPALPSIWDIANDVQPYNTFKGGGASGHVTQDLGFASLVSITAYRKSKYDLTFDGDAGSTPLIGIDLLQRDRQFSQELQLASASSSRIKWVTGVFYFNSKSSYDPNTVTLFGPAQPLTPIGPIDGVTTIANLRTKSWAGYAQATAPIFEATNLTLGFRYTTERRSIDAQQFTQFVALPVAVPTPIAPQSKRFSKPTWRASIDHRFSPEVLVYASYNRGFKSGGYNGQFPSDAPFLPEKIDAYEVGAKTDLFDRRLRVDAAAFYYDYSNIQVARYTGSQISYYNGASARVYGLDADFEARVTQRLTLSGGVTLLHDRFTQFPNAIISTQTPTGVIASVGSATGNRLPLTPDFSGTVTIDYKMPVSFGELGFEASENYDIGYYTQPDNILRQKSYHLVSAAVRVAFPDGLTVRGWVRNLANAKVATTLAAGSFDSNAAYQPPRTFGLTFSAKF